MCKHRTLGVERTGRQLSRDTKTWKKVTVLVPGHHFYFTVQGAF